MQSPRIILVVALLATAALLSGCVSTGVRIQTIDAISAAVRPVAKNVVNLVLQKNGGYDTALLALADGADAALNGGDITVENIRTFVDTLATRYAIDSQTRLIIASSIDDLAKLYRDTYGKQVAVATDPNVRRILTAFAQGVRDGVAFYRAMTATVAAVAPPDVPRPVLRPLFGALGVPAIGRG